MISADGGAISTCDDTSPVESGANTVEDGAKPVECDAVTVWDGATMLGSVTYGLAHDGTSPLLVQYHSTGC